MSSLSSNPHLNPMIISIPTTPEVEDEPTFLIVDVVGDDFPEEEDVLSEEDSVVTCVPANREDAGSHCGSPPISTTAGRVTVIVRSARIMCGIV